MVMFNCILDGLNRRSARKSSKDQKYYFQINIKDRVVKEITDFYVLTNTYVCTCLSECIFTCAPERLLICTDFARISRKYTEHN